MISPAHEQGGRADSNGCPRDVGRSRGTSMRFLALTTKARTANGMAGGLILYQNEPDCSIMGINANEREGYDGREFELRRSQACQKR